MHGARVQFAQLEIQSRDRRRVRVGIGDGQDGAARIVAGYGVERNADASRRARPRISTMATSMPSSEVPLMIRRLS